MLLTLLFVVHALIALALIGVIMLQKSEGGALGMGGGGMSGFMTGRSTANLLTRTTAILAGLFFLISIALVVLSSPTKVQRSIIDQGPGPALPMAPAPQAPGAPPPAAPVAPAPPAMPSQPGAPVR
jgi:preprotein translocase subunit SecG